MKGVLMMKKTLRRAAAVLLCLIMTVGLLSAPAIAVDGVAINATNFPDEIFRLYVANRFDHDGDGYLSEEEIGAGYYDEDGYYWDNSYGIYVYGSNISSLKGIEYFIGLTDLDCSNNKLTSLDLSKNTLLERLYCSQNQLTAINVSKNTDLTRLYCDDNKLTLLDVSKNTKLETLSCERNKLKTLDISKNTALTSLSCHENPIGKLDIRNNPKLLQAAALGVKTYWSSDELHYYIYALNCSLTINSTTRLQTGPTEPPAVTKQPKDKAALAGKSVTLSVTATGNGLKYQWYACDEATNYEWKAVKGGTDPKLTVKVKKDTYTRYYCEITNNGGSVCTKEATVSRAYKPYIYKQPSNKTAKVGKTVTFKIEASGGGLKYQWYYQKPNANKWSKVKNGTSNTLKIKVKKSLNGYKYRCVVSNAAGKATSRTVKLKVKK